MPDSNLKISLSDSIDKLNNFGLEFIELFRREKISVELYRPDKIDRQQPHLQDEIYFVLSGKGDFYCGGETVKFDKGDLLFVPGGVEHRFENFTDDFITWVVFFGKIKNESTFHSYL
jgi:mannose-6-phosphate isomerase-like protein (cupin superfamily)